MEYKNLLIALSNFSKSIATNSSFDKKNIDQITTSINSWKNSHRKTIIYKYKIGKVYKIDFGLAYKPELAYEHMGIIISKKDNLYYVVPITTLNKEIYKNPYHYMDNPQGNSRYFLLKSSECDFLDHDSIAKCNDVKTVSYLRIKKEVGIISNTLLQEIIKMTFNNIFPTISYNYNLLIEENKKLNNEIDLLKLKIEHIYDCLEEYETEKKVPA